VEAAGDEALVVNYGPVWEGDDYASVAGRIARTLSGGAWTLVVHSGAGGLAQAVAAATKTPTAVVFVDAILPHPGRRWLDTAPRPLVEELRRLAVRGLLPPWNLWFPSDPLPGLIPNGEQRAAFAAELPLTPLSFLEAPAPHPAVTESPSAFLQLSAAYAAEALAAESRGWPVARLNLNHLAMITHPREVAAALRALTPAFGC
jgi:hypothetical protein